MTVVKRSKVAWNETILVGRSLTYTLKLKLEDFPCSLDFSIERWIGSVEKYYTTLHLKDAQNRTITFFASATFNSLATAKAWCFMTAKLKGLRYILPEEKDNTGLKEFLCICGEPLIACNSKGTPAKEGEEVALYASMEDLCEQLSLEGLIAHAKLIAGHNITLASGEIIIYGFHDINDEGDETDWPPTPCPDCNSQYGHDYDCDLGG